MTLNLILRCAAPSKREKFIISTNITRLCRFYKKTLLAAIDISILFTFAVLSGNLAPDTYMKHIYFDNDGTIVDSEILAVYAMLNRLKPLGFDMDAATYSMRYPGLLEKDILKRIEMEYGIEVPDDFIEHLHRDFNEIFDIQLAVIDGMDHLFRDVKIPKSMVSNARVVHVERCMHRIGLFEGFEGKIFSAEHVARPKPSPDVYLHALAQTGVNAHEAVAIEDSPTGVSAAKAAGIKVIGFLGAAHIADGHEVMLLENGADYIAENASALREILVGLNVL